VKYTDPILLIVAPLNVGSLGVSLAAEADPLPPASGRLLIDRALIVPGPAANLTVTGTAGSTPGSLRRALLDARSGDTITFDPTRFPPAAPARTL
jgi:hypothetical protein